MLSVGKLLVKVKLQLGFFFVDEMGCPDAYVRCTSGQFIVLR